MMPFIGEVEWEVPWNSVSRDQHMLVRKMFEKQGIKLTTNSIHMLELLQLMPSTGGILILGRVML